MFFQRKFSRCSVSRSLCSPGLKPWRHVVQCNGSQLHVDDKRRAGGLPEWRYGRHFAQFSFSLCTSIICACAPKSTRLPRSTAEMIQGTPSEDIQPPPSPHRQAPTLNLTCLPGPHGGEPIPRSAWGRSARSDSSDSAGDPGRPLTGWPRASCHSCPHNTAARRRKTKEEEEKKGQNIIVVIDC